MMNGTPEQVSSTRASSQCSQWAAPTSDCCRGLKQPEETATASAAAPRSVNLQARPGPISERSRYQFAARKDERCGGAAREPVFQLQRCEALARTC
jgi:hypothetical protein